MQSKVWLSRIQALVGTSVRGTDLTAWIVIGLIIFAVSIIFNSFGLLHYELSGYISYHLGPGSVWEKIFDNRTLDQGTYQGREFSYLVDHLDVLLVALSVKWGCPMFVSATHVCLCIFIGVWIGWFAAKDLRLGSLIGLLLALLFWTTPFVYLHFLLRSAKVLTAAALVALIVEIGRALVSNFDKNQRWLPPRFVASIVISAWVLSFSDRQGFFFHVGACLLTALQWLMNRDRVAGRILLLLSAVLVLELVYFFWVAPALNLLFFGDASDFSFNRLPVGEILEEPFRFTHQGLNLLIDTCSFVLGHLPRSAIAFILIASVGIALVKDISVRSWHRHLPLAGLFCATFFAIWMMNVLMISRHPPLLRADVQLIYYWIPTGALIVLGIACVMGTWAEQPWKKTALAAVLLEFVFRNVAMLPDHSKVLAAGHLAYSVAISPEIRDALMHRDDPSYLVPPEVLKIPVYYTLLTYAPAPINLADRRREFGHWLFQRAANDPGAPVSFVQRFGGNVDSRFLSSSSAEFFESTDTQGIFGITKGFAEMRIVLPVNNLRGTAVLQRRGATVDTPVAADFAIYTQSSTGTRSECWKARLELPAGEREKTLSYAIATDRRPAVFTINIPQQYTEKLSAGWRNPTVTDLGGETTTPVWFTQSSAPIIFLDEAALAKLLPENWRPIQAQMRNGRVTATGIELSPGGEIWLQVKSPVSKFTGTARIAREKTLLLPLVRGVSYKAGRLQVYSSPQSETETHTVFQSHAAESDCWLVIVVDPNPTRSPVLIRVTEAKYGH